MSKDAALAKYGLIRSSAEPARSDGEAPIIGVLPGSRTNEIRRLMPVIIESMSLLAAEFPEPRFLLFRAASVPESAITAALAGRDLDVRIIDGQDYDALQCCDAVMTVSGTATLEVALLGIPMAIVYRLSPLSYWLGRLLVKVPFIGLPNILAGKSVAREFIQHEATPDHISAEIVRILRDQAYAEAMRRELLAIRASLGDRDGSAELARLAARMLDPAISSSHQDGLSAGYPAP